MGYKNPRDVIDDLFAMPGAVASYDFPSHLQRFYSRLSEGSLLTPHRIIMQNTLFPFYKPFLSLQQASRCETMMKGDEGGDRICLTMGVMASSIRMAKNLKYCPTCIDVDRKKYKGAYWHRSHQLPGVEVCHKHFDTLIESEADVFLRQNNQIFEPLEKCVVENPLPMEEIGKKEHKIFIAQSASDLLNKKVPILGLKKLQERYIELLRRKGFVTPWGKVRQTDLLRAFKEFYGENYLLRLGCQVDEDIRSNWLSSLVRTLRSSKHPLYHLLLMQFLGVSPVQFLIGDFTTPKPFGDPPYPCLNKAASHYLQPVVTDLKVVRNKENGLPLGEFHCSCGFTYVRTGPDKSEDDKFRRTRIISMGRLWENTLVTLSNDPRLTLKEIAKRLGVDQKVIKIYRKKLEEKKLSSIDPAEEFKESQRNKLLKVVGRAPGLARQQIKDQIPSTYVWLLRHDKQWLSQNLPARKCVGQRYLKVHYDWNEKDEDIYTKAKKTIEQLLNDPETITRITYGRIGKTIKEPCIVNKKLDMLPKTKAYLEATCENIEDFQLRRVRQTVSRMVEQGEPLSRSRVIRMAGLGAYSLRVSEEIEAQLATK